MSFQINTNLPSLLAQENLRLTADFQSKTISRVTSGLRIVSSGDDAAGLAIANSFRSDIAVLGQGMRNANDGLSTLQTIDGGINNISKLLDRARTLATQSASGTLTGSNSRNVLNSEFASVLTEINRQAQSIGLNTGGQFAKALSVFIGGGKANGSISEIMNGAVSVDLSRSMVDAASLGLQGVQASGAAGTDIGQGAVGTTVSNILANTTNTGTQVTAGYTDFYFQGPGFGDSSRVKVSVNTTGVTDVDTLVTAVNAAIQSAGNGASQSATAFKNANVVASVNTDSTGAKQLVFRSSNTSFQVEAGDRTASALLGEFERNASLEGTDAAATVATNGGGTANQLTLAVDGGSGFTVNVTNAASVSKGQIVDDLNGNGSFSAAATAYLDGNQIVLRSKGNSATSAIAITGTTLSTNLGLSGTATAASASTGATLQTQVQGSVATAAGSSTFGAAGAGTVSFRFTGANLSSPVDVSFNVTATSTVDQAIASLKSAVAANSSLQGSGITLTSGTSTNNLVFTSSKGEKFNVAVTGDLQNKLGFGSFVPANGVLDYSTLQGLTYNNTSTAAGTNATLEFSINGAASNGNAVTVDLTAGDATAATVTSSNSTPGVVNVTKNNNTLNLVVNGNSVVVNLTAGVHTKDDIANTINTQLGVNGTATVSGDAIVLQSATKGRGGSIQVLAGSGNALLGFTASATPTFGTSRTGTSVAAALNTAFAANPVLQAASLQASFGGGQITVASNNATYFRMNARGSSTAASVVGTAGDATVATAGFASVANATPYALVGGASDQFKIKVDGNAAVQITISTLAGFSLTAAQVAADLNNGKLDAPVVGGSGATASVDGTGHLVITSNTTGAGSTIALSAGTNDALAVLGAGTSTGGAAATPSNLAIGGASNKLRISVDGGAAVDVTLTTQTSDAGTIATDAQTQINAALVAAGQTATVTAAAINGRVKITSASAGANSSIAFSTVTNDAYTALGLTSGVTYTGREANLGYGTAGVTFTGNTVSAAPATSTRVDAGGSAQTAALDFNPLAYGSDQQVVTLSAIDGSGVQQSKAITLHNDAVNRSGRSLDEAIDAINTALQQTNNSTLQKIVAVKDNSAGTEKIRFLSTLGAFKVAVGTTANPGDGIGSQGQTVDSAVSAGGSSLDISSQATAEAAVTTLAAAVSKLGDAQAVVGRGQNQFNFAINLASSQLTNLAAAESRIRDADLAAEAANLTKAQISIQAGIAALAQANSAPQAVLALLRG
jgi:flagellin